MSDQEKRELLEAAKRAMARLDALSPEEKVARLERVGILSEDGELSERYGGPGRAGTEASEVTSPG